MAQSKQSLPAHSGRSERFRLDGGMRLGAPTLRVKALDPVLSFYERDIGFTVVRRGKSHEGLPELELGFRHGAEPILRLVHDPAAGIPPSDFAGLYHYAILLPHRKDLASTFLAVGNSGVTYEGFADHSFSESLYLHDIERNGIEIYADRPRTTWPDWGGHDEGRRRGIFLAERPSRL